MAQGAFDKEVLAHESRTEVIDPAGNEKPTHGLDEGIAAHEAAKREGLVLSDADRKRLLKRFDLIVLPLMCMTYGIQYLDKTSLSYASVMGLQKDLHLDAASTQYQWLGTVFYFSYLVVEFPNARLMQLFPIGRYVGICCLLWGIVAAAFAAADSFASGIALRLLLGAFEACVAPAFTLIISQYYTKEEQSSRTAIWVTFSGLAQIFGGLVAYGIAVHAPQNHYTVSPWKIVFILFGCMTVLIGLGFALLIPRNPLHARWLSEKDRILAVERLKTNQQGIGTRAFKWAQLREAFTDPFCWGAYLLAVLLDIPTGGLNNFFNQLIVSFGYTPVESLLYGGPAGAVIVVAVLAWGLLSARFGNRLLWSGLSVAVSLIGACLVAFLPVQMRLGRLLGYYLSYAYVVTFASMLSLLASNVAGTTKKATVSSIFFVAYCVGNIIGPQTFRASDKPTFRSAQITIVVMFAASLFVILFMYVELSMANRRKERARNAAGYVKQADVEFLDWTDRENPEFVYSL